MACGLDSALHRAAGDSTVQTCPVLRKLTQKAGAGLPQRVEPRPRPLPVPGSVCQPQAGTAQGPWPRREDL